MLGGAGQVGRTEDVALITHLARVWTARVLLALSGWLADLARKMVIPPDGKR